MVLRNKIVTTAIILLLLSTLFSGCIEEKNTALGLDENSPTLRNLDTGEEYISGIITKNAHAGFQKRLNTSPANLALLSKDGNIPEIKITSFSSVYLHDNNEEIYLFSWETVPGNESYGLLNYLKYGLQISWVGNAQITKDDMNKTIRVFNNENSIEIIQYTDSPYLKIGNRYDWWVREENGTHKIYDKKYGNNYVISERYYAVYDLSIKNKGSSPLYFKLKDLRLHEGGRIFNATTLEPNDGSSLIEVFHDLENENKLRDTVLLPGQSLNGIVAFRVNSLYNKSFILKYDTTTVTSVSFEKSIEALWEAEHFNYGVALGVPPYTNCHERGGTDGSYEPIFDDYCDIWANWMNRSIFETFQKYDVERMQKSSPYNIPVIEMVYALRVIPERNMTMYPVTTLFNKSELHITDDTGEEIINTSRIEGMAVMSNKTYTFKPQWNLSFPGMNLSNASAVRISFSGFYFSSGRMGINNQDVILDDKLNIIVVRNYPLQFVS